MLTRFRSTSLIVGLSLLASAMPVVAAQPEAAKSKHPRNIVIFVADGLRHDSVNAIDTPNMLALREYGVHFVNSHALFPTFTTPNAAAIATGHYLGDTGDFGNTLYSGYPTFDTGNFGLTPGTVTPFVENDQILADLDSHFNGDYLNEETLLQLARLKGYNTAAIGKLGPVAIQDVSQIAPVGNTFPVPETVFIDDATGTAAGIPLRADVLAALTSTGLPTTSPNRSNGCAATAQCSNGFSGNNTIPGTTSPNTVQQQFFADALTKAVLPTFSKNGKPFAVVFWSRDPDGTQHNQGDSLNKLSPGINGPTSKAGVHNADNNLGQILAYITAHPELAKNTDIFITSDHGFATISRHEVDAAGDLTKSYSTGFTYKDTTGRVEVNPGFLPGFLAIDIAHHLNLPLFDPDSQVATTTGAKSYEPVDPTAPQQSTTVRQRPAAGNGVIGGSGQILEQTDAKVVVAANGGSDLIYVPDGNYQRVAALVRFLSNQDYIGSIFVDDAYGPIPGSLPLSSIGLVGTARTPRPTIALSFKTFYLIKNDLLSAVQIADTTLQEGQGMHGSLGRDNTFNNMEAIGPDFKDFYVDRAPVSNADIARTLVHVLGFKLESNGGLRGRVLHEALRGGQNDVDVQRGRLVSEEAKSGRSAVLLYQEAGQQKYFDEACQAPENVGQGNPCR